MSNKTFNIQIVDVKHNNVVLSIVFAAPGEDFATACKNIARHMGLTFLGLKHGRCWATFPLGESQAADAAHDIEITGTTSIPGVVGMYPDDARKAFLAFCKKNGLGECAKKWEHLNTGMIRMNLGNVLRARARAGAPVELGETK